MVDEQLRELIVDGLVRQRDRNEIIQTTCERSDLDWPAAEKLVQTIEQEQAHSIAQGQAPFLIFLSVTTGLVGAALLVCTIQFVYDFVTGDFGSVLSDVAAVVAGSSPVAAGITGLAMMAGGGIGLWKTSQRYFET